MADRPGLGTTALYLQKENSDHRIVRRWNRRRARGIDRRGSFAMKKRHDVRAHLRAERHGRSQPAHAQQPGQDVHKADGVRVQHLGNTASAT